MNISKRTFQMKTKVSRVPSHVDKKYVSYQTLDDSLALFAFILYHYVILAHIKEFGKPLAVGGHPDNGLGRLSEKLDFITWIKLQNA
jgi:hypothetical protein